MNEAVTSSSSLSITDPIICSTPPPLSKVVLLFVLLLAFIVLVWTVWRGWKKRENIVESEKIKRILGFCAYATAFAGIIDFLLSVASELKLGAIMYTGETMTVMSNLFMAESLYYLAAALGLAGLMFLVYLAMPWRKTTAQLQGDPQQIVSGDRVNPPPER